MIRSPCKVLLIFRFGLLDSCKFLSGKDTSLYSSYWYFKNLYLHNPNYRVMLVSMKDFKEYINNEIKMF